MKSTLSSFLNKRNTVIYKNNLNNSDGDKNNAGDNSGNSNNDSDNNNRYNNTKILRTQDELSILISHGTTIL